MSNIPSFEQLKQLAEIVVVRDELRVSLSYENFQELISQLIACIPFDEEWYLEMNPDVRAAVEEGQIESGAQHFIDSGYFEGRLPSAPEVDEEWYLLEYPDVAERIQQSEFESAYHHFVEQGFREGRSPSP